VTVTEGLPARAENVAVSGFDADALHRPPRAWMSTLFGLAFVVGGYRVGLAKLDDNSFLWHFRTGRLILDDGIPRADVYSYTAPGSKWIAQSWLAEISYALLDRVAGPVGIRIMIGVCGALLGLLMWRSAIGAARDRLRAAGVTLIAFVTALNVFGERPLAFGMVAAALIVLVVEQPDGWLGRRPLISVPLIFWLWGNSHGSMSLGFVFIALHLLGRWTEGASPFRPGRERTLLTASVVAAAAIACNPYGPQLLVFPFDLVSRGDVLRDVVEWMSPDFRSPLGMAFGAWIVLCLVALALGRNRATRRDLVVLVPFLVLGLWAQRNVGLAAIVGLPIVARCFAGERRTEDANPLFVRSVSVSLVALTALFTATAISEPDFDLRTYPTKAFEFLDDEGRIGERIFTSDRDGGFVIAKYWPDQTVFLDDRFDMYPPAVVEEYEDVAKVRANWSKVLDKYLVTLVVWERTSALTQLLDESDRWQRIYTDKDYVVFERVV
jgi:hypothetical protein